MAWSQNEWIWKELLLAQGQMQDDGFSRKGDKIHQAEQARDKAMAEVWFLSQELEEDKNRNAVAFQWIQNRRTIHMEENLSL